MKLFKLCIAVAAAVLLPAATSGPALAEITDILDSADFPRQYEFNVDGVMPNTEDIDSNGTPDWTYMHSGGADATVVGGLFVETNTNNTRLDGAYFHSTLEDEIWNASGITWQTGYTVEVRVRVNSLAEGAQSVMYVLGLCGVTSAEKAGSMLNVSTTGQTWRQIGGSKPLIVLGSENDDNSDDLHVFRIAQEPGLESFSVWRDNVLLASGLTAGYSYTNWQALRIGDATNKLGGNFDIDYVRFTPGAYAPIPEPGMLSLILAASLTLLVLKHKTV